MEWLFLFMSVIMQKMIASILLTSYSRIGITPN